MPRCRQKANHWQRYRNRFFMTNAHFSRLAGYIPKSWCFGSFFAMCERNRYLPQWKYSLNNNNRDSRFSAWLFRITARSENWWWRRTSKEGPRYYCCVTESMGKVGRYHRFARMPLITIHLISEGKSEFFPTYYFGQNGKLHVLIIWDQARKRFWFTSSPPWSSIPAKAERRIILRWYLLFSGQKNSIIIALGIHLDKGALRTAGRKLHGKLLPSFRLTSPNAEAVKCSFLLGSPNCKKIILWAWRPRMCPSRRRLSSQSLKSPNQMKGV